MSFSKLEGKCKGEEQALGFWPRGLGLWEEIGKVAENQFVAIDA